MTFARNIAERREKRESEKAANLRALATVPARSLHRGTYAKTSAMTPAPKTEAKRNPALLEMAQGRDCLLRVPGVCTEDTATTVACHRNEGKGMGLKQSDEMSCWGCAACHKWYDQSGAPREAKRTRFMLAHMDQVLEWRKVAQDPSEPERFRKAALWALHELNAEAA